MLETGTIVVLAIIFALFVGVGFMLKISMSKPEAGDDDEE